MIKKERKALRSLAIDIGAESGRIIQGSFFGDTISLDEICRFSNGPVRVGDHLYIDTLNIWNQVQNGIKKSIPSSKIPIRSVGVDTWGVDYALLDKNNNLLAFPYHYRDRRTNGMLEKMFSVVSKESIYQQTGNQFMQFNSLVQLYTTLLHEPHVLENTKTFLMLPDLFHYWLCGEKVNELCIATTSQCYNQAAGYWALHLLEKFQIPGGIFHPISPPGRVLGSLLPWLAEGSKNAVSVVLPASHDTASAVTAIPAEQKDYLYISSGTWSLIGTELEKPLITPESLQKNLTNEGNPFGMTKFLKVVPGMWILHQCKQEWKNKGTDYSYSDLTDLASCANDCGAVIDLTSQVFLDPGDMVFRIQEFCRQTGQPVPNTDGEIVYCILKSLACLYRSLLEDFEHVLNKKLKIIYIIGGGSKNALLNQLTANITKIPVVAGPVEATATGNVLMQLVGLGYLSSLDDVRQVVRNSFRPRSFDPDFSSKWENQYFSYKKVLAKIENGYLRC